MVEKSSVSTMDMAFVERLERYFLEGRGNGAQLQQELEGHLTAARSSENDGVAAVLEDLKRGMERGVTSAPEDMLPVIFSLRSICDQQASLRPETENNFVEMDLSGTTSILESLNEYDRSLLQRAAETDRLLYLLTVDLPEMCHPPAIDAIEAEYSVIRSERYEHNGTLQFLLVTTKAPKPADVLSNVLPDSCGSPDIHLERILFEDVLFPRSVETEWYDHPPTIAVNSSLEHIARLLVLSDEMTLNRSDDDDPLMMEIFTGTRLSLSASVRTVCKQLLPPVRELARELKKKVSLTVTGAEGRLSIVDAEMLNEPLRDIVANAIRHGIESPEGRIRRGKSGTGTVRISVAHHDHVLMIRIHDDGRGVTQDEIARAFAGEAQRGLGRVRRVVQEYFSGRLTVQTSDRGTTVDMELPYGNAMHRAFVFRRLGRLYTVPAILVTENLPIDAEALMIDVARTTHIPIGNGTIPLLDVDDRGRGVPFSREGSESLRAVHVTIGTDGCAIAADEILGRMMVIPFDDDPQKVRLGRRDEHAIRVPIHHLYSLRHEE